MGNPNSFSSGNAFNSNTSSALNVEANTPAQKRALSYASTIKQLFDEIQSSKMPADRILANYFREHKKHGSKDRKIIRESLFSLFRWWGWFKQLGEPQSSTVFFANLSASALLEAHAWRDIACAWHELSQSAIDYRQAQALTVESLDDKLALMRQLFPNTEFKPQDLLPDWFWQVCPIDTAQQPQFIAAMSSRPPIWGRAQGITSQDAATQLQALGIEASFGHYFSDAINLGNKSMNLNEIELYKDGKIEIQDLASQVIGQICAPEPDAHWWDACSGAGGKTLQLRSLMLAKAAAPYSAGSQTHSAGSIISSDIRSSALDELTKRAQRAHFNGISVARWKSDALPVPADHFDGVLVDAPCSCTGTWRRNPDMRWLDSIEAVTDKAALQLDILSRSSRAVKTGGVLVYATCSLSPIENQDVVTAFLQQHPEFTLTPIHHPFTGEQTEMLTVWPFEANSDGMFVAKMHRRT
ncbi:RsmB/NOP family class I SAM-dependent RNA methyltransferase [Shewanella sp. CG12_big_fil_rev_8_21_14_0_65_47_15]|uniref:RsmB/NOP family class I SAM-dependent RNA methyltransferase n=1 Tax=Shewanella sp. CG12_big_fil_rev_8_21_14_0_65_47_15 TaxID=1975537 RepID=UPI000CAB5C16|nr:RsmB/NOP family class I SAM-dependent RNA methyltransferase [Shewanella sp. CG12_big_fil_rev_8_21_14_0_65_47_15]PIW59087.1 MAG: SAM-dependent methyltransferase [Shewanella sp. CG12_big_fil_rev_8_21_14_0_65_47_15]